MRRRPRLPEVTSGWCVPEVRMSPSRNLRGMGALFAALGMALEGLTAPVPSGPSTPAPSPGVVRQVDHLLIVAPDAQGLVSLMAETFQWPVAWPFTNYGGFASGGLSLGNVNLEILQARSPRTGPGASEARFTGFALEPVPLATSLPTMKVRGIRHGVPSPFRARQPDGTRGVLWTTVSLPEVSTDSMELFLCEYREDVSARRQKWQDQLRQRAGGPLTVSRLREIRLGDRNRNRLEAAWKKLVGPPESPEPGVLPLGPGPMLRWVPSEQDAIQGIVIEVRSLAEARAFLGKLGMLGTDRGDSITLGGAGAQGLKVTFTEQVPNPTGVPGR